MVKLQNGKGVELLCEVEGLVEVGTCVLSDKELLLEIESANDQPVIGLSEKEMWDYDSPDNVDEGDV